jgi:hypothetical protein
MAYTTLLYNSIGRRVAEYTLLFSPIKHASPLSARLLDSRQGQPITGRSGRIVLGHGNLSHRMVNAR